MLLHNERYQAGPIFMRQLNINNNFTVDNFII